MGIFSGLLTKKKPKKGGIYLSTFLRKTRSGSQIADERNNRVNEDLTQLRYGQSTEEIVRSYSKNSPDVSHALETIIRFCVTDSFTLVAKNLETDTVDIPVTQIVQSFASRINKLPTLSDSFSYQSSLNSVAETLVSQMLTNGTCASELVLDKSLLPSKIQPISTNNLKWEDRSDRLVPYIDDQGKHYLDSPAVNIISLTQDPDTPYAESWFKSAVQSVISSTEFMNDLRRSFRKASLPRVTAEINAEKFLASLSPEVMYDEKKLSAAMTAATSQIEEELNGLQPEDAVVFFDTVKVDHLSAGNISSHESVAVHAKLVNGQISTGLHILPSLLGRGESQTTSSSEAVLFLKVVESLQDRLNEVYSYLFTMSARLQGYDVTVTFKYKKPSLRPAIEEEAFLSMQQSRILEQLSLGLISDEEASIYLTGDLPSGDFSPLSGTMFHQAKEPEANAYSNTSVSGEGVTSTKTQKDRNKTNTQPKTNNTTG